MNKIVGVVYMWVVHFKSESGDDYYASFDREPTEGELKTYIVENLNHEIEDGFSYVHASSVEKQIVETPNDNPDLYKDIEWL